MKEHGGDELRLFRHHLPRASHSGRSEAMPLKAPSWARAPELPHVQVVRADGLADVLPDKLGGVALHVVKAPGAGCGAAAGEGR